MNQLTSTVKQRISELRHEHPGAMVILLTTAGYYLYASPNSRTVLGYEPKEMVGRHATDFAAPEDIPHVQLTMQDALLNDESVTVKVRARTKSGGWQQIQGAAYRVVDPDTDETYLVGWVTKVEPT